MNDGNDYVARINIVTAGYVVVSVFFAIYAFFVNVYIKLHASSYRLFIGVPFTVIVVAWLLLMTEYIFARQLAKYQLLNQVVKISSVFLLYGVIVLLLVITWFVMLNVLPNPM